MRGATPPLHQHPRSLADQGPVVLPRIVDISDSPARLALRQGLVVIDRPQQPPVTFPVCELGVVLLAHPQISVTQPLLAALASSGAVLIACDERRLPAGMFLSLVAHSLQAQRMAAQAAATLPTRKRLWQQIVRAKIRAQALVLVELRGDDAGLPGLVPVLRQPLPLRRKRVSDSRLRLPDSRLRQWLLLMYQRCLRWLGLAPELALGAPLQAGPDQYRPDSWKSLEPLRAEQE